MNLSLVAAIVIGLGVVLAWVRLVHWQRRAADRSRGWRLAVLLALQPLCGALLYLTLVPPPVAGEGGELVVATRHASAGASVALPEAPDLPGVERVPDLATALRRHGGTPRLRVLGDGLEARDRDAARGLSISFAAPPLGRGLIRLDPPARVAAGGPFGVAGRVNGHAGGSAELVDPAGQRVGFQRLTAAGAFEVEGTARVPGLAVFTVRVRDAQRQLVEAAEVPVSTVADTALKVFIAAGAPGAEVKYLRRWAEDAGLALHTEVGVGGGRQLGDPALPLTAATLQRFDLLVLDDRSWAALGGGERAAVADAVRGGLGLLLRVTGPLPDATRRQWRSLGLALSPGTEAVATRLPLPTGDVAAIRARRGPGSSDAPTALNPVDENPELTRRVVGLAAADATPLLRDTSGAVLASWRAEGRGRVGVLAIADSFGLVLAGQGDRYEALWSRLFEVLSRRQPDGPRVEAQNFVGQRLSLCNLPPAATVIAPGGRASNLLPDPATRCAAYWPRQPGWHRLPGKQPSPFYVYPADALPGVRATTTRDATLRLAAEPLTTAATGELPPATLGAAWPWFLTWLTASALLWWFERARFGRQDQNAARNVT